MELPEFRDFIDNVMDKFYKTEADLLDYRTNNETNRMIHELNISFHIGYIILCKLKHCDELKDYKVDAEYNKHGDDIKMSDGKMVRPDIIIHKRGTDDNNFAWIEIKKPGDNAAIEEDRERLRCVTQPGSGFNYNFGALIIVGKTPNDRKIEFYQDGELKCSLCLVSSQ
ncbi:MAG: hypothetical protein Q4F60_03550 [Candidatus Saccharibacteria bacterium]|nr:hypothetical protein [Candidatus Saccharibacteria bacterium]